MTVKSQRSVGMDAQHLIHPPPTHLSSRPLIHLPTHRQSILPPSIRQAWKGVLWKTKRKKHVLTTTHFALVLGSVLWALFPLPVVRKVFYTPIHVYIRPMPDTVRGIKEKRRMKVQYLPSWFSKQKRVFRFFSLGSFLRLHSQRLGRK